MATATLSSQQLSSVTHSGAGTREKSLARHLMMLAGSLKITVVMFLAATFLLFIGTLAQDEKNLPEVKAEYFNSWIAKVPFSDFFPVTVFGESSLSGWFPFPGGATIGLVLLINLIAAKMTRFHVAAHGKRLWTGILISLLGAALALAVILFGHQSNGLQGQPPIDYQKVWRMIQLGGFLGGCGLVWGASRSKQRMTRFILAGTAAVTLTVTAMTVFGGDAWRMNDPGLRIMWQLIQSSAASLVLLAGLVLVFGPRGGNVLIHIAVGVLMLGQFVFGDRQIEERMNLIEGQTTNMAVRTDETELALIDRSDPDEDAVTAISTRLLKARTKGEPVTVDNLPFDIEVLEYFPNSSVVRVGPVAPNLATTGLGTQWLATKKPPEGGASDRTNIASAYVQIRERSTGDNLGTYLVSQFLNDQSQIFMGNGGDEFDTVDVDGTPWQFQLRFRREYKPYNVTLNDVRKLDYAASDTPRDYSSYITFRDTATSSEQKGRIWMNNPVRYRGETFYQSNYSQVDLGGGQIGEMTGLQVVENAGWLIPYVACVLAFWGMLVHFGGTFVRFAGRHERESSNNTKTTPSTETHNAKNSQKSELKHTFLIPALAFGFVALCVLPLARTGGNTPDGSSDWTRAGTLPVMHEGRIKPFDSVARTTAQLLSNRTSVLMPDTLPVRGPSGRISATQWLFGHMAGADWADYAPIFRIDALEVLDLVDLTRRKGHRYSAKELEKGRDALRTQIEAARKVPPEQRSFVQKKYGEINQKLMAYDLIRFASEIPPMPQPTGDGEEARQAMIEQIGRMMRGSQMITAEHPPAVIPPVNPSGASASDGPDSKWQAVYPAVVTAIIGRLFDGQEGMPAYRLNPAILPFTELLSVVDGTPSQFNSALTEYQTAISGIGDVRQSSSKVAYEAWLNAFNPTFIAQWLYILATVLCFISFLAWHKPLNRFISWMLIGVFLLHTFAIISRIYLTERPPVINLHSSAVFIGWACVIAGLALEYLERFGIGNLVAAASGGLTLMVAYGLDKGDTMHVLQAVLDTQFWLSTHVITVTLGYGATFLAGMLGTCAIIHRLLCGLSKTTSRDTLQQQRSTQERFYRMTYGVVCFALFFSFIGTVLGGLWADDSWGRFWGWDPKENGALMIVLWNAAILHARWDRWIGQRGFALFAIGGNIVTAWSWFGTNQLGIGLHSYGFTSGVLMLLAGYVLSQLVLILVGAFFTRRTLPSAT